MNMTLAVIAILFLVSVLAGLSSARSGPEEPGTGSVSHKRRVAWFLVGFFVWPLVASFLIFLLLTCWDLIFTSEEDIAELEEMLSK